MDHSARRTDRRLDDPVSIARRDPARLSDLRSRDWLYQPPDDALDRLTWLAAKTLDTPIALLTLVDRDRDFYASKFGPWPADGAREFAGSTFCQLTLTMDEPLLVDDALTSPILRDLDVVREGHIESFAGVPLKSTAGHHVGCFCVAHRAPRTWSDAAVAILSKLGEAALHELHRMTALRTAHSTAADRRS